MTEFNEMCSEITSPKNSEINKRDALIKKAKNGEFISNSKTPWTEKRLKTASEKKINQLYDNLNNSTNNQDVAGIMLNNFLSKELEVKNFQKMMCDLNENPLLKSNITKICGNLNTKGHTSMELFGAMMYSKFGMYLAPVSAICTIFSHLDWESFERISRERERFSLDEINDISDFFDHIQVDDSSDNKFHLVSDQSFIYSAKRYK